MAHGGAVIGDLGSAQLGEDTANPSEREYAPDYASPEHGLSERLTVAADVYGLGCVAFEILTLERWVTWRQKWNSVSDREVGASASHAENDVSECVAEALRALRPEAMDWAATLLSGMLQPVLATGRGEDAAGPVRYASMDAVLAVLLSVRHPDALLDRNPLPADPDHAAPEAIEGDAGDIAPEVKAFGREIDSGQSADTSPDLDKQLDAALDCLDAGDGDGALALLTELRDAGYRSPVDDLDALIAQADRLAAEARLRAETSAADRAAYAHVVRLARRAATRELGRAAWERYVVEHPKHDDPEGMAKLYPRPVPEDVNRARAAVATPSPEQQALLDVMLDFSRPPEKRAEAGQKLAAIGDPRPGVGLRQDGVPDIDWVEVPGGKFVMGDHEKPPSDRNWDLRRAVEVPRFWMSRYATTWAQYEAFLTAEDGYGNALWWGGLAARQEWPGEQSWKLSNHPTENVSWYDAMAYTRWLSACLGYETQLPTEEQWEKAARGTDGRRYPWGNAYEPGRANINEKATAAATAGTHYIQRTTAVGIYLQDNPYGLADMAGNVWEWTLTEWESKRSDQVGSDAARVVRGGSWDDGHGLARAASRYRDDPDSRYIYVGFRLVSSAPPQL